MKTIEKPSVKSVLKIAFGAFLFLAFSCSPDSTLKFEENLEEANAKSKKALNSILKELASGATLKAANGIDIGPDGNLYIASILGQEIVVMNKQNGKIIKRLGLEMGVKSPDDLVFGPDGSLYWTDILVGEVGRMTPEGLVTKQFVAPGVNPITFSTDGRLFVALDFLGDGLYELDPDLIKPPRPIIEATPGNPFPLGFFNAFDFGADGRLYGPLFAAGLVISVDVGDLGDPPSSDPFVDGIALVVATGFENPAAAKFGPGGILYVVDQTGEVFKVNPETGNKTLFATLEPGLDNLVFDSDGTLYITNADQGWVAEILPSGQARTISRGGMIAPQGLAVIPGSNKQDAVFVADLFNLRQFNGLNGKAENIYKGFLVPVNSQSLILPMNLSSDGNNLVISSWFSGAVQVWDPKTQQVLENYPMGAPIDAIRFKDDIVVSDLGLGGVVWASDNSMILPIDNVNVFAPGGLATDGETVWMADWGTGLVWQIDFDGKTPNAPVVVASGLANPEGLTLDMDGHLLVVETGASQLSRIDLFTGEVTKIVDGLELSGPGLEGFPPTWYFDGVAIGQSGDIYVSGGGANVIYRISSKKGS
ncbi:MAG: hypothetical protein R6W85_07255 [Gillisia sp.]